MEVTLCVKMKTIPCEESVLCHNKRNKNIAFPSYPDHYLKEMMHPRSKTGLIVAQLDGELDKQQTDCTHQGHGRAEHLVWLTLYLLSQTLPKHKVAAKVTSWKEQTCQASSHC